jgi:hypothetical protein
MTNLIEMIEQILLKNCWNSRPIYEDDLSFSGYSVKVALPIEFGRITVGSLNEFLAKHELHKYFFIDDKPSKEINFRDVSLTLRSEYIYKANEVYTLLKIKNLI